MFPAAVYQFIGPHGYGGNTDKCKEAKRVSYRQQDNQEPRVKSEEQQESELLCLGEYVFPNFHMLAMATLIMANDFCFEV